MKLLSLFTACLCTAPLTAPAAVAIFTANFDDSSLTPGSGPVTAQADYGTVGGGGAWGFGGSASSYFGGIAGTSADRALVVRHNTTANPAITDMPLNAVALSTPSTATLDAGGGGRLLANFGSPGGFTSPGESTSISLDWGTFGNSNNGIGSKYNFLRGLDASGNELFEILMVAGSAESTRDLFIRGAADSQTTITGAPNGNGVPQGTNIVTSMGGEANSTSLTAEPATYVNVGIVLENGTATFTFTYPTGTETLAGVTLNSAATSISQLEFTSIWGSGVNGQNKGYWLDNVNATYTVPEPGSALISAFALLAATRRRRF